MNNYPTSEENKVTQQQQFNAERDKLNKETSNDRPVDLKKVLKTEILDI